MSGSGIDRKASPGLDPQGSRWTGLAVGFGLVALLGLGLRLFVGPGERPLQPPQGASPEVPAPGSPRLEGGVVWGGRCAALPGTEPLVLGESVATPKGELDAGEGAAPDEGEPEEQNAPFAVEVGRGSAWEQGFAVGFMRDAEGGTVANLATLDRDGSHGRIVRLARSRGDMDPPVVVGLGASVLAGVLEPNAGGRALRLAKVTGGEVTWGPELAQGRDESLAFDLAAGARHAVVAWDEYEPEEHRSSVLIASLDPGDMRIAKVPHPVSLPQTDADSPRLVTRPGGYWLAYLAHGAALPLPKDAKGKGGEVGPSSAAEVRAAAGAAAKEQGGDDEEESDRGETVSASWLEVMPLDEDGLAAANPQRVTPQQGRVLAYDLELGGDGGALLAWTDDDGPSGAVGGAVSVVLVQRGGPGVPVPVVDEGVGSGVPDIVPGWVAVTTLKGSRRLAPLSEVGALLGPLAAERSLGLGEILAAQANRLLVGTPTGRAVRLSVLSCDASVQPPPESAK